MYKVMIVEDDPMVAAINRQYVELNQEFRVCGIFKNGKEGLDYLKQRGAALVILDYYMPLMNGREFLAAIREMEERPEVIMVTAAGEAETVRALMGAGILDYLVKPFEYARFEQALERFRRRRRLLGAAEGNLSQSEIDRLLNGSPGGDLTGRMQKGLQEHTLEMIRQYMKDNRDRAYTSEDIAEQVHLSRVTIRRYVNYMLETHEIASTVDYHTGGRPSIKYKYVL